MADLWYHAWFPRYCHLTLFVTEQEQEQQQQQELGILGVGLSYTLVYLVLTSPFKSIEGEGALEGHTVVSEEMGLVGKCYMIKDKNHFQLITSTIITNRTNT